MGCQQPGRNELKSNKTLRFKHKKQLKLLKLYGNIKAQTQEELGKGTTPLPGSSFFVCPKPPMRRMKPRAARKRKRGRSGC